MGIKKKIIMNIREYKSDKFYDWQIYYNQQFENKFSNLGYTLQPSIPVSQSIDSSVRFIGSITNVFKTHFYNGFISEKGYFINQDCLKTRMLQNEIVSRCSFYPSQGILANYKELPVIIKEVFKYIIDIFDLSFNDINIHLKSNDYEFIRILNNLGFSDILIFDELEESKYIHAFGIKNITGRNIAIFTKPSNLQKRIFIATIIIVEKNEIPIFVEVTIKPISIIQYINRIKHEIDCYPKNQIETLSNNEYYKFQDSIIVATLLFREGILPTNRNNRDRLFRKYVLRLLRIMSENNLSVRFLVKSIMKHEINQFGSNILNQDEIEKVLNSIPLSKKEKKR